MNQGFIQRINRKIFLVLYSFYTIGNLINNPAFIWKIKFLLCEYISFDFIEWKFTESPED